MTQSQSQSNVQNRPQGAAAGSTYDNWSKHSSKAKQQWDRLTDDDINKIAGDRPQLLTRIQERHSLGRDEAERQLSDWEKRNPDLGLH